MQPGRQVAPCNWASGDAVPVSVTLVDDNRSGGREVSFWPPADLF